MIKCCHVIEQKETYHLLPTSVMTMFDVKLFCLLLIQATERSNVTRLFS